ncbi:putative non-structural maintenance of chromosomes element [Clavispora lusitaniae]|uniref:Non-structural maintenance of chromosomes element 1 homolog n=2 Tax=Clavispora lusitaniae TaxID=36911 RepID=C4Y0S7_CLAL4|nr:uncharacterized protein CLUG_01809 [Clavispora lusitaniae ATCC 42720]KAF5211975.1 hypothetical protein E0198_001524 [Clavispora lusitaniae]EEQ37686.1 hypothetical protein CLUG_01809 [Clavispora lusitaniae ATCC 42720]KAF7583363.1 Nse1 non-SMC component of SMC5-6 complex family protein [Clavispora lusitaniae]QFZ26682.1 putative non-structural maintenance of chromosomes element [Clavispora lusitaniae]QFZ32350.1 putative non-structural maintenance of chromosomes element [Clavispora lusitaniae]
MYTEAHRALLTYIRAVKVVSADRLTAQFSLVAEQYSLQESLRDFLATINVRLERYGFKIDSTWDQDSGAALYVFVNTRLDDVIQSCTPYSPPELDAIKELIDTIVSAPGYIYACPMVNARQQIASTLKRPASDATYLLKQLVDDGWVSFTSHNRVVLAPAALAELRAYLEDRFGIFSTADPQGKLLVCNVCRGLVTLGQKCITGDCPTSFHDRCMASYQRGGHGCPACGKSLEETQSVGEG